MAFPEPFPKIHRYRGAADPLQEVQRVVCTEKIDGANARVGVPAGATRREQLVVGGRHKLSHEPDFSQPELVALLEDDALCQRLLALGSWTAGRAVTLYGELCGGRIQGGQMYGTRAHLVLFAARVGGAWVGYTRALQPPPTIPALPTLQQLAEAVGVPVSPVLYEGPPAPDEIAGRVERASAYSAAHVPGHPGMERAQEGLVIWSDPVLLDPWGAPLVAKLKDPRRREYTPGAVEDGPEDFARRAVTPERLRHAREFLEQSGRWRGDAAADTARLVRRVIQDVAREVAEYGLQISVHGKKGVRAAIEARARQLAAKALL